MKYIVLLLLISCAQKYQTYHTIEKSGFTKDNYQAPITKKMFPGRKVQGEYCAGQFFFATNAKKDTDRKLPELVYTLCPKDKYLLNSKLTETWWTTIIYSRSCVELESYCPRKRRK